MKTKIKSPYNIMSNLKTFSLTIDDRRALIEVLSTFKGSIDQMALLLDDGKSLYISDEEYKTANLIKDPTDEEVKTIRDETPIEKRQEVLGKINQVWKWDSTYVKDIPLSSVSTDFMIKYIQDKSDKGEISLSDVALINLKKKL